ncbi:type IV pilus secretin PilQ family protein [Pseudidiomarina sp.]|uniref:type IV pilus secretin PilQ n=1 Tax=Pseudidiomarina sp. TaxID=2081707 RepID=UPI00299E0126|nr:type IV pilus secretin PilQ family protein [Pseudidiomarina sp.]MDX1706046.1 type IV pilus secretin PilQ family protein [Pseudidiomarina sp.]
MTHLFRILLLLLMMPLSVAANELVRIEQIPLAKDRFNLEAHFTGRVDSPIVRRSQNPLIHEFLLLGTESDYADGPLGVASHPLLKSVELVTQRDDLLLRVTTTKPLEHLMSRTEDVMVLVFIAAASIPEAREAPVQSEAEPRERAAPEPQARVTTATDSAPSAAAVTNIDFTRLPDDVGLLRLSVNNGDAEHEVRTIGNRLELTLFDTYLPEDLLYVLDVSQFGSPVAHVETFRENGNTLITVTGKEAFRHQLEHLGNDFNLKLFTIDDDRSEAFADGSRQPISLNFQDVPVRQLLQILAEENGLNLVASESVTGNITLRLENVPWERALETILRVKGLAKRIDGNILIVAPAAELAQREQQELEASQRMSELAPLSSSYIQINYAKASEIASILRTESSDLLSARGAVTVDDRTNTLLVRDTAEQIANVKAMVEVLDIPVKQVIIEARMVTVRDNISDELGIEWGLSNPNMSEPDLFGSDTDVSGDFNVNLPVSNPAATFGMQIAKMADGRILDLELSALERENKGEIIASPRITTANQKPAYIEQGTEIPYVESASSGATSVQFKKAVLGLRVTPQITPDNRVILDLVITQNTRGDTVSTPTGPAVSIDTQEIGTQVLVENGETIVLGGIYQQQILNDITKVPLLGDIPYVGVLFRNESQIHEKRELLIFVTPRIVTDLP